MDKVIVETTNGNVTIEPTSFARRLHSSEPTFDISGFSPTTIDLDTVTAITVGDTRIEIK